MIESNEWSSNFFGCCSDQETLWHVLCFGCCAMTDIASYTGKSDPCCYGWFGCFCYARLRSSLREKHSIPGTSGKDCLLCLFLCPCMACQMVNEIKVSGHEFDGYDKCVLCCADSCRDGCRDFWQDFWIDLCCECV